MLGFIDTETTGAGSEKKCSIWQIAIIITDDNLNEVDRVNLKFKPREGCTLEEGALEKTGMSVEKFRALEMSYGDAYKNLIAFLERLINRFDKKDKLQFVAYNAQFDARFLRQFFLDNGDNYYGSWFWHPPICLMMHAAWMTRKVRKDWDSNFRLESLCKAAGINFNEEEAHDALYDVEKTIELYKYFDE